MASLPSLLSRKSKDRSHVLYAIDEYMAVRGVLFVRGWSNLRRPAFRITCGAFSTAVSSDPIDRADLAQRVGPEAAGWGFDLRLMLPREVDPFRQDVGLTITGDGGEIRIPRLTDETWPTSLQDVEAVNERFRQAVQHKPDGTILEIGSRARSGHLRKSLFGEGLAHTGVDVMAGEGVDVVADVHFLSDFVAGPFDFAYSVSTFEHLVMPWQAAAELARVMAPDGLVLTQTHQTWPVHDAPWDFFRFSRDSWKGIFNELTGFEVLATAYGEPALMAGTMQSGSSATRLDFERGYLMSNCLARRIGPPLAPRWAEPEALARILEGTRYPA